MEHFFTPVHSPPNRDEITPQKHHHQHHHQHPPHHRHHPYHQDAELQSYTGLDEYDRNTDDSHGHHQHDQHHQHGYHLHEDHKHHDHHHHHHHHHRPHHGEQDETASSSYFSSSSSLCSSSSWYTDASANDHGEQPQHAPSCSNIVEGRGGFQERDGREPIVYANVSHEHPAGTYDHIHGRPRKMEKHVFNSLHRSHSRSDEGMLQTRENELGGAQHGGPQLEHGPLYKTASMSRAVSSSPLPGKGILKNKEPPLDIRKAKSLEVLSPRVAKEKGQGGEKGKGPSQMEVERASEDFVKGKLQFSAFLDDITKQVISPSYLNILGVTNAKASGKPFAPASAQATGLSKPQLSLEKHKESPGEEREEQPKQQTTQGKSAHSDPQSHTRKHANHFIPEKIISYAVKNHRGSPPPHHSGYRPHSGGNRRDRRSPPTEGPAAGDRYNKYGPHLTDGTSSSPELILPKRSDHRKQQTDASCSSPPHPQHQTNPGPPSPRHQGLVNSPPPPASAVRPGSEAPKSPKSRSDSSRTSFRTRNTASSATSQSSEHSDHHRAKVTHTGHPQQHKDSLCDDHLQVLQEENADLHQNLLQTVVCIESLEAELQRTKEELSAVKDKYKSLLETHTGTRQANSLLGEHLHIASESLSSERKYLISRITQLSSELEDANRTIAAMDNISVPCLIKQLLEKHFDSTEAIQKFLTTVTPVSHSAIPPQVDNQPLPSKLEEMPHDVLKGSEADRATAFIHWRQEAPITGGENCASDLADLSTAIYQKIAVTNVDNPRPVHPQPCYQQTSMCTNHTDTIPNCHHACSDSRGSGMGEEHSAQLEVGPDGVTYVSAQMILDDLKQQLHPHKEKEVKGQEEGPA